MFLWMLKKWLRRWPLLFPWFLEYTRISSVRMNADFVKVNLDYSIHRVIAFILSNKVIRSRMVHPSQGKSTSDFQPFLLQSWVHRIKRLFPLFHGWVELKTIQSVIHQSSGISRLTCRKWRALVAGPLRHVVLHFLRSLKLLYLGILSSTRLYWRHTSGVLVAST